MSTPLLLPPDQERARYWHSRSPPHLSFDRYRMHLPVVITVLTSSSIDCFCLISNFILMEFSQYVFFCVYLLLLNIVVASPMVLYVIVIHSFPSLYRFHSLNVP